GLYTVHYRKLNTTNWTGVSSVTNQLKITNLIPDSDYEFKVRIYKHFGPGLTLWGISQTAIIRTGKVDFTTITDNGNSIEIGWPSNSPWANYYTLQYSLPSLTTWVNALGTSGNTSIISPVLQGQDYYVRLWVYSENSLWGITQEQKVSRMSSSGKELSIFEDNDSKTPLGFNLYPNPFVDQLNFEIESAETSICDWTITDMTGRTILKGREALSQGQNTLQIDGSLLAKGIYLLNSMIDNEKHEFRLIKE
ncbi:MAG: T9SS type A sorting domain-containing protein, partial [Bacteroidota bacterium]